MVEQIKIWMENEAMVSVILKHGNSAEGTIKSYDNVGIVLINDQKVEKVIPYTSIESINQCLCWDD